MDKDRIEVVNRQFDKLPVGGTMDLPLSLLNPIIPGDGTRSHSSGCLEVYRNKAGKIMIDDGNHRFYNMRKKPNEMVQVRKVIPEIEW